ncbi:MAG: hypothetical protein DMG75_12520, partial [Acidobacteria bacterium]
PIIKTGDELERLSTVLNHMIARLDDAFQHINRFSADASHELRTPLTILLLELEGMIQHYRLDPELVDQIGSALEETHRLSRIVENLLVISRLDAGEVHIEKMKFDLGELAVSTVDQMKLLAEEKLLSMQCHAAGGVYIEADQARLKQVIVNLMWARTSTPPRWRYQTAALEFRQKFSRTFLNASTGQTKPARGILAVPVWGLQL